MSMMLVMAANVRSAAENSLPARNFFPGFSAFFASISSTSAKIFSIFASDLSIAMISMEFITTFVPKEKRSIRITKLSAHLLAVLSSIFIPLQSMNLSTGRKTAVVFTSHPLDTPFDNAVMVAFRFWRR